MRKGLKELDDAALAELINNHNEDAYEVIYHRYCAGLYGFALKYCPNTAVAQDIVQEAFISLWQKGNKGKLGPTISAFLCRTVLNQVAKEMKRQFRTKKYQQHVMDFVNRTEMCADHKVVQKELYKAMNMALDELSPDMRWTILRDCDAEGPQHDTAQKLNIPLNTFKKRTQRIKKTLSRFQRFFYAVIMALTILFLYRQYTHHQNLPLQKILINAFEIELTFRSSKEPSA